MSHPIIDYSSEFKYGSESIRIFINPERTWAQFLQRVIPIVSARFHLPPHLVEIWIAGFPPIPVDASTQSIRSQWNSYADFLKAAFHIRQKNVPAI